MTRLAQTLLVALAAFGLVMGFTVIAKLDRLDRNSDERAAELARLLEQRAALVEKWAESNKRTLAEQEELLRKVEALEANP